MSTDDPSLIHHSQPFVTHHFGGTYAPISIQQDETRTIERLIGFGGSCGSYNIAQTVHMRGVLDVPALEQSLQALVDRHHILRTSFEERDGILMQLIHATAQLVLPVDVLDSLPDHALEQPLHESIRQPFDLSQAPLMRARLIQIEHDEHVLVLVAHRLSVDLDSLDLLVSELQMLYATFAAGMPSSLEPLRTQYFDYVQWQRERLSSEAMQQHLAYWRDQLAGMEPLHLLTDRPRPVQGNFTGEVEYFELSPALLTDLTMLAQAENATVSMVLLAAFQILLMRYTRHTDIAVVSPTTGRIGPAFEGVVGPSTAMMVLRADLSGDPTFKAVLARVRKTVLGAIAHQELPYNLVVTESGVHQDRGPYAHCPVAFVVRNATDAVQRAGDVYMQSVPLYTGTSVTDVQLVFTESNGMLHAAVEYRSDLFDATTMQRLATHFQTLLTGIVADPETTIADLPLLEDVERHRILVEWNDTARAYPLHKCIHEFFEDQVQRTPNLPAVCMDGIQLTYQELDQRANQLAHYLRSLDVQPEMFVGVCLERSIEQIVGLLGILKAGGAYVPLDPFYPADRLAFMMQDADVKVLLTQQSLVDGLPYYQARTVCLDSDWSTISLYSDARPTCVTHPDSLAYAIYTSGSTGRPKGVLVAHIGLSNLICSQQETLEPSTKSRVLQFASCSFDASLSEIFMALANGGTLLLAHQETLTGPDLHGYLRDNQVTHVTLPPSVLSILREDELPHLRVVISTGEACNVELARRWGRHRIFINGYGPTENSICTTIHFCTGYEESTLSIGRPIANLRCYILDARLQPTPTGVPGELYVGGVGLARGYLNRADLTAEKFILDPFRPGEHLYQTGDLARYFPDGTIDFLGRIDHQVKVRGIRIELGEIETALNSCPGVKQSVVVMREVHPGDKRLIAYVVYEHPEDRPTVSELRRLLGQRLPSHMLPSAFVPLDAIPLTPNGKVDRRALPEPHISTEGTQQVGPRSSVEQMVWDIWREVLKIDRLDVHDNFWDMGGHSLLATQVIARVRSVLGIDVPLRALFEASTVAELAARLQALGHTGQEHREAPIPRSSGHNPIPLSAAQEGFWFLDRLAGVSAFYNIPWAVRLRGSLDVAALERSLQEVVDRHATLRTCFEEHDGVPVQVVHAAMPIRLSVIPIQEPTPAQCEQTLERLVREGAQHPFDLAQVPLICATLLRVDESDHVLLIVVHHIVSDAWSVGVLAHELRTLYTAFVADQPSPLASLQIQFSDYAHWEREHLVNTSADIHLAYWRSRLDGLEPLQLPSDTPRSTQISVRGGLESVTLPNDLVHELRALARNENVTLFMVLLAAFQVVLMRWSGQEDVAVGTPSAGRNHTELETLIGCFLNTLVLRTDLSGNPTFKQLLRRVRHTTLDAYSHQSFPFDTLVAELSPTRQMNRNPLFDVMINYMEGVRDSFDLPGLSAQELKEEWGYAKFAVTLYVEAGEERTDLHLSYQSDLFSRARMICLLDQYTELLRQVVAAPQRSICDYSLVTPASRAYLPDPTVAIEAPTHRPITEDILAWTRTIPQRPAICLADRQWNYGELGYYASSLAATLLAKGVQRGDVIAIQGTRSHELIGTMLAVLLSGGAFLTIDPVLPSQRRQVMLREAGAKLLCIVGQPIDEESVADAELASVIIPVDGDGDTARGSLHHAPHEHPLPTLDGNDPAYVFFTSGSTGAPKAILGCHKGLAHFLQWQRKTFDVGPADRVSQLIGLSFDPLLRDVFLPLVGGATLCIPQDGDVAAPLRWLQRAAVTVVHTTPTLLHAWLLDSPRDVELPALRWLFVAGEPLTDVLIGQWRDRFTDSAQIVNLYGPTETTMAKCFYPVPATSASGIQPVGRSLPETQALVVNTHSGVCGVGETGEIVLRTPFRSLGYLNLPDENHRRFRKNPFRDDDSDLLYFTGDLGRYRPDGTLEIVGRIDDQVKIRGVRVEPGEVTATLARHDTVSGCIVIARTHETGEHDLVAYVVREAGTHADASQLRTYLSAQLADAFVPRLYVFLEALPVLPNGKVDRKALPAPAPEAADERKQGQPRGPIEEALWEIWREVLKRSRLSVHDNFFELGGHSLLATQIVARIRDILMVDLPLRAMFETPTLADLAHRIEQLRTGHGIRGQEPPIEALAREGHQRPSFPASFSQRRMWFVQQYEPEGTAYNMPFALRLMGPLNRAALARAVNVLAARHEAFRTTFVMVNGELMQVIGQATPVQLHDVDLRDTTEPDRIAAAMQVLRTESMCPFDLEHGPLHRFYVVQLDEADHVILWLIHHSIGDLWSAGIMFRELAVIYRALNRGESFVLPPLPIQYADFAAWQRRYLGGAALDDQLAYWRDKLIGLEPLALPTDKARPPRRTFRGGRMFTTLPDATVSALKQISVSYGVTPFMSLLASFQLLLARYSGQEDIAVGSPIANRTRVATENLIGTFINTLVIRTDLSGNPTFGELLARVRDTTLDAYAHQDLPFERLVEEIGVVRDASRAPVVQVLFNGVNVPIDDWRLDGLASDFFPFDPGASQFDLGMAVNTEGFKRLKLSYATDLFEPATAERLLKHYVGLIEQVVTDPNKPISAYRIVADAEYDQIVHDWNPDGTGYPYDLRTDEIISAQAQRTPDAIAVSMGHDSVSYATLDARANQLAHYLRQHGVGPATLVGICLERSINMIVALLAVMKSGGAYVPLDPHFPRERLELMALDAGLAVVLTQSDLLPALSNLRGQTICIDRSAEEIAGEPVSPVERRGTQEDLAYVLYTSGSTGRPKGVEIPHRALTNLLSAMRTTPGCDERDMLLSVTTLSFDIAAVEMYLPLTVGGRVELASQEEISDGRLLLECFRRCRPTIMQATPATWRMLIDAGWGSSDQSRGSLRILCGGETLSPELAVMLLDRCAELWNLYGPTETTIWSTVQRIDRPGDNADDKLEISIGCPIANTSVYILDSTLQPVPIGVYGELFIGGHGVARGYHNRSDLTAERFVANPFSHALGDTMYRTGDLARWLPDGRIVHIGRLDFQVKIRGFRIELGEIETVLARHPAVAQVVAAAKNDRDGMRHLVAYMIRRRDDGEVAQPSASDLRAFVRASLPSYMVPSHFVFLDAFPLTANNKVSVKALPDPADERLATPVPHTAPHSSLEVQLTALWRQVLGNETVGIHDDFFELGGHSLKAVQLLSYIKDVTGKQLPLATLFEAPTVAHMAHLLTQSGWQPSWRSLVAIQPTGSAAPMFAVPGIGGNVLTFAKLAKLLGPEQPFYGLQAKGLDGTEAPFTSILAMAEHHIREIRSVRPHGPYVISGTCIGGIAAYEIAQRLRAQGEEVTLIIVESWPPSSYHVTRWPTAFGFAKSAWFVATRLGNYAKLLANMPLHDWPEFLRSKAKSAGRVFDKGINEVLAESDFQVERVVQATLQAAASYKMREYPGRVLNVIATKRQIAAGRVDTRVIWDTTAQAPSRREFIPAEDSGRMFVSPHVEVLAKLITEYVAT